MITSVAGYFLHQTLITDNKRLQIVYPGHRDFLSSSSSATDVKKAIIAAKVEQGKKPLDLVLVGLNQTSMLMWVVKHIFQNTVLNDLKWYYDQIFTP